MNDWDSPALCSLAVHRLELSQPVDVILQGALAKTAEVRGAYVLTQCDLASDPRHFCPPHVGHVLPLTLPVSWQVSQSYILDGVSNVAEGWN